MKEIIPDVSVIIPVYAAEKYIEKCACSLFDQLHKNIEFIFVDDCSPDRSIAILKEVERRYPKRNGDIHVIRHTKNKGVAAARNTGLKHAKGSYIGWVDADDWIEPGMFSDLYLVAFQNNSDLVWCDFFNSYECYEEKYEQRCKEFKLAFIKAQLSGNFHSSLLCTLIKKELYINNFIRFADGVDVMEDKNVLIKLSYYASKINYVPVAYYHYVKYNQYSITAQWGADSEVEKLAKKNLDDIFLFLEQSSLAQAIKKEIRQAKLIFKRSYLNIGNIDSFRRWKNLFGEVNNRAVFCSKMTVKQRVLGLCITYNWQLALKLWIKLNK